MNPRPTLSWVLATRLRLLSAPLLDVATPLCASLLINSLCLLLPGGGSKIWEGGGFVTGSGQRKSLSVLQEWNPRKKSGDFVPHISWWSSVNYSLLRLCTRKDSKRTFCQHKVIDDSFLYGNGMCEGASSEPSEPPSLDPPLASAAAEWW